MIKLEYIGPGRVPDRLKLCFAGATVFPKDNEVIVFDEGVASELEQKGWRRDAAARKDVSFRDQMLRKAADTAAHRGLGGGPRSRVEIGEVETYLGRIRVVIDASEDVITLHGVSTLMAGQVDEDLRMAIIASAAAFNEAERDEEQVTQRAVIGALVDRVLRANSDLAGKIKGGLRAHRFTDV